ncbi:MAG: Fe2+-dependent dioxygenase [Burkholderiales bacterium]
MITCIANVLNAEELETLASGLRSSTFSDGAATAGWHARGVKNNLQLTPEAENYAALVSIVRGALTRNAVFQMAVRPRFLMPILFNRYETGMQYGSHVDDALMLPPGGTTPPVRTDVSFTLFLSDPASYQGGELIVNTGGLEYPVKLTAGSLIAYPSNSLHRVEPVTSGARVAAIGWIQSEVRDPAQREVLFDLDTARRAVFASEGKSKTFDQLSKSHANLLRMWVQS